MPVASGAMHTCMLAEACSSAVSVLEVSSTFSTVSSCSLPSKQAGMDDRVSIADDDLYMALGTGAIDEEEFALIIIGSLLIQTRRKRPRSPLVRN